MVKDLLVMNLFAIKKRLKQYQIYNGTYTKIKCKLIDN